MPSLRDVSEIRLMFAAHRSDSRNGMDKYGDQSSSERIELQIILRTNNKSNKFRPYILFHA